MKHPPIHPALTTAIAAALPPIPPLAQPGATPRNKTAHSNSPAQNEPTKSSPPCLRDFVVQPPPATAHGATPRNKSAHFPPPAQNEPTTDKGPRTKDHPRPLTPRQRTAARLLLAGHPASVVAQALRIHRYTLTRWQRNPRFQAELDHQLALHLTLDHDDAIASATPRNTAQQNPTFPPAAAKRTQPATMDNAQRTTDNPASLNHPSGFPATSPLRRA